MSSRLLDAKERLRFSAYCRQQAKSCKEIAKQMGKDEDLDRDCWKTNMSHAAGEMLVKHEQAKAHAYTIVAVELEAE